MRPTVSVCMNTYQHPLYIRQAIDGVLMQQTTFPFELVIGEDYSQDGTRKICEEQQLAHPEKIRLLPAERNIGQSANLARSIAACTGRYIALCEGDDYWIDPLKLQKQVDFLDNHPDFVMCFHQANIVDHNGRSIEERVADDQVQRYDGSEFFHLFVPTPSLVFRNCLDAFPPAFFKVKSTDAFIVAMLSGYGKGADLRFIGSCYRMHEGGLYNRLSRLDKFRQSVHTRKMMRRSSYFNKLQHREISREL
ncbi:MAG TPA: glycosyltransferase, partial [Chitinophagaceae bacterium]|nr:glycosyltransferase [Chitinophagaceae bacterium]